ncbi:MAG: hypothetical protein PWP65_870 [Clostridia bacterium]|nr:hypothetical protein [Clostridia bacterium]
MAVQQSASAGAYSRYLGVAQGLGLTLVLAFLARNLAAYPFLSILGSMVLAIILGLTWRAVMGVPVEAGAGIDLAAKKVLRLGIILMGLRLDIPRILAAGPRVILLDALVIAFAFFTLYLIGRKLSVGKKMAALIGVGTGVCGAAAIAAAAPSVRARDDETAVAVSIIALLGTLSTLIYTFLYPFLNLSAYQYGVFSGATLHELAHVIAAAQAGGAESIDTAILVKLGRVALLAPVVILLGLFFDGQRRGVRQPLPIPWFIFGFLAMSGVNTLGLLGDLVQNYLIQFSAFLITIAMAGLGLNVELGMFKRLGARGLGAGVIGSAALSIFGSLLLHAFKF